MAVAVAVMCEEFPMCENTNLVCSVFYFVKPFTHVDFERKIMFDEKFIGNIDFEFASNVNNFVSDFDLKKYYK